MIKATYSVLRDISPRLAAALGDSLSKQVIAGYRNDDLTLTTKAKEAMMLKLADDTAYDAHLTELAVAEIKEAKEAEECSKK